jgi:hypothetical protein
MGSMTSLQKQPNPCGVRRRSGGRRCVLRHASLVDPLTPELLSFYRQVAKDSEQLVEAALKLMAKKFSLYA